MDEAQFTAVQRMSGVFDRGSLIEDARVQSLLGSMVYPGTNTLQTGGDENSIEEGLPETEVYVQDMDDQIEMKEMNYEANRRSVDFENADEVGS